MQTNLIPKSCSQAGFSLIEIILALGIISFALVGILGLFPVAVKAANDSQQETQAALIARSIFEQLESRPNSDTRTINLAKTLDKTTPSVDVKLTPGETLPAIGYDIDGSPLANAGDSRAVYQVTIKTTPVVLPGATDGTTLPTRLSEVRLIIKSKTSTFPFTSILSR